MSVLTTNKNLALMYSDQLLKAQGDIKNNPHLTRETIEYVNKHGVLVTKMVYKNHEPKASQTRPYGLVAGDPVKLTSTDGRVLRGTYVRKVSQPKASNKPEFLEIVKPDNTKVYVKSQGPTMLERLNSGIRPVKPLTLVESIEKLVKLGCDVYQAQPLLKIHQEANFDLLAVFNGYNQKLDKLSNGSTSILPEDFKVVINERGFKFNAVSDDTKFIIKRSVNLEAKTVNHESFYLDPDYQQGGVSKDMFKTLYQEYSKIGIKSIGVHANCDLGGYTWMAYGFSCELEDVDSLLSKFKKTIGKSYPGQPDKLEAVKYLTVTQDHVHALESVFQEYKSVNRFTDFFPMNILASTAKDSNGDSVFKNWLISTEQDWYGRLDLTNRTQREYFETYIGYNES